MSTITKPIALDETLQDTNNKLNQLVQVLGGNLTPNRAVITNNSGNSTTSNITSDEIGYLSGLNSNVQSQINNANTNIGLKQNSTDNNLGTTDKTVVGAINELNAKVLEPIIINAESNTTVNGYQVPVLSAENIQAIYNGIVAGREVVVTDATENMHFKVNQANTVSDEIFISYAYFDVMLLQYDESDNITYKELASKNDIAEAIGNAIEGEY